MSTDKYEAVIGLEIHVQLNTNTKAYSSDRNIFGSLPNTNVNPISLGHPGTLPIPNKKAIEFAVSLGLACGSKISRYNEYARKNYFYPDLPKGYQITQDRFPICTGGTVKIKNSNGEDKEVQLTRIHMEEDTGKSIHDIDPFSSLVDLNRAGVPLLEIVTEPDFRSSKEAYIFVGELRRLVRYLDISNGNMEEGSLRCDTNVSIRLKGDPILGTRVEVKNMNSISNIERAINFEIERQIGIVDGGGKISQETRTWDAVNGKSVVIRTKEDAHDYRYFYEPDIQPIVIEEDFIIGIKESLPPLPSELIEKYTSELGLSLYDAQLLTDTKEIAMYFEELIKHTSNVKASANILMGVIKSHLNERAISIDDFPISPKRIADLIHLIDTGKVSNSAATIKIFPKMLENLDKSPMDLAKNMNLIQDSNADNISLLVKEVLDKYPKKIEEYKGGKTGLLGMFMGEIMKLSKGKADPKLTQEILKSHLDKM
ncbi:Asp-tRNA(Asn)/Glu-tRNA(Gln) amidotransferase subunit GatB [Ichthyobacterium seriolicida]|nr:Asp-tRNA(Asn)/Glu-tRNA(Gln) amidotransferase subunit GatB [Ichthyobacterium seriolicida]